MTDGMARLLRDIRRQSNGIGLLGVEIVLHCAEKPRTVGELEQLTGANNGSIARAINQMAIRYQPKSEKVQLPVLHLLAKTTRPEGRGFEICLTARGAALCRSAGLARLPMMQGEGQC